MYYISKRDNITRMKVDEKYSNDQTVMVEYLNGKNAGKTSPITRSTFKRWWKKVEDEQCEEQTSQLVEEKPAIFSKHEKKSSNKRLQEKEKIKGRLTAYDFKYIENVNCYKIFKNSEKKKAIAEIYPRCKHIEVRVKSVSPTVLAEYKEGYKYYLPVHYFIAYEHINYLDIMETLLKSYL